jgi:hypothetical protein
VSFEEYDEKATTDSAPEGGAVKRAIRRMTPEGRPRSYNRDHIKVRFHEWPTVSRAAIVLPEELVRVLERNGLGILQNAEKLRQSGWASRHDVLFYAPPGTGKTLVVRYLAEACNDHTVILPSGRQLGAIRESFEIARLLIRPSSSRCPTKPVGADSSHSTGSSWTVGGNRV